MMTWADIKGAIEEGVAMAIYMFLAALGVCTGLSLGAALLFVVLKWCGWES